MITEIRNSTQPLLRVGPVVVGDRDVNAPDALLMSSEVLALNAPWHCTHHGSLRGVDH